MASSTHISDKPRVLVLTGWYPSIREPNNGDFVKEQIRLLRREGLLVDLIYADLNVAYLLDGQVRSRTSTSIDIAGCRDDMISGPFWPKNQRWGIRHWIRTYSDFVEQCLRKRKQEDKPHLIHAHTYLGGAVASRISKTFDIPYIITEHYTGWLDNSITDVHKRIGQEAFEKSTRIWAVSPALCDSLQNETSNKVEVFSNFIDASFFIPNSDKRQKNFHYIGVGDLIARKNWKDLILAFAEVSKSYPSSRLSIAGDGPMRDQLLDIIRSKNIESKVSLVGHLNRKDLLSLYQSAHALLHTSHTETFGLSMIEAMSCGIPVITYPHQTANYILNSDYLGILTEDYSVPLLVNVMQDMQDNYSKYSADVIRKTVEERFGAANAASKLRATYSAIMQG